MKKELSWDCLNLDIEAEITKITRAIRGQILTCHRKGAVIGVSGGIDSSVVAALCAKALKERTFGILMPETENEDETTLLGKELVKSQDMNHTIENISPILDGAGCYRRRNDAIRKLVPEFTDAYKCKIVLPNVIEDDRLRVFSLVVQSPSGDTKSVRMDLDTYLTVVAASNFKQRTRKMIEYFHADRLNYAVAGTPNRLEYDQGFFVKNGDGSADFKPIAHLYKTQVYALAAALGVPESIRTRPPTTDTYSLPQSQEEFYFSLPYDKMDLCLYAHNNGYSTEETANFLGLTNEQIQRVFRDIETKRRTTRYQHLPPLLVEHVPGIQALDKNTNWEAYKQAG